MDKQSQEESQKRKKSRTEKFRREKMQVCEKGTKIAKQCVFPMFCGSRGSERRLAKAVWRHLGWADDLILVLVNENLTSVVQQSTFGSDKCQNMSVSEHFWKLSCGKKCALLWREAHFGVKSVKQFMLGPLLEVELWKKNHTVVV